VVLPSASVIFTAAFPLPSVTMVAVLLSDVSLDFPVDPELGM
jgi:hypothetical protein